MKATRFREPCVTTLRELLAQREALDRLIEQAKREQRGEAIAEIRSMMSDYGLTTTDLGLSTTKGEAAPAGATRKVPVKYRDAATGASWSGRGLQPRWLRAALLNGKKISDFAL